MRRIRPRSIEMASDPPNQYAMTTNARTHPSMRMGERKKELENWKFTAAFTD